MPDPRNIPDDLIERAACAMQGFNAIMHGQFAPWDEVHEPERGHWLALAKAGLIAVCTRLDTWK